MMNTTGLAVVLDILYTAAFFCYFEAYKIMAEVKVMTNDVRANSFTPLPQPKNPDSKQARKRTGRARFKSISIPRGVITR